MKRSVIIVEDEPNARAYLAGLVRRHEVLHLLDSHSNGQQFIEYVKEHTPDIVLLDIEMPGVNGIEVAKQLSLKHQECIIIFTTAYDEYAIEAFKVSAVGYLLKPFSESDFSLVINKAIDLLNTKEKAQFHQRIERLWNAYGKQKPLYLNEISIKEKGYVKQINVADIVCIHADSEYVTIITLKGKYLKRVSLNVFLTQLPAYFHRVHRSFIINRKYINSWSYKGSTGQYVFEMTNGERITSSRSYKHQIRVWIEK